MLIKFFIFLCQILEYYIFVYFCFQKSNHSEWPTFSWPIFLDTEPHFPIFSPVIVESDADLKVSSRRIVWGKWTNCGQTCIAPDYVLVAETLRTALVNELIQRLKEFYGSEPEKSEDYSRIINEKHFEYVIETVLASKFCSISKNNFVVSIVLFLLFLFINIFLCSLFFDLQLLFQ